EQASPRIRRPRPGPAGPRLRQPQRHAYRRAVRQLRRRRRRLARQRPAHGGRCRDEICGRPPAPAARAGGGEEV
ncbi:MAG: FIG01095463: hypothetical protein, partial [uncultured Sphingomonas sp.]